MFSPNNNSANPLPHLSPPFNHHNHHQLLLGHLLPANAPVVETTFSNIGDGHYDFSWNLLPKKKKPVKKDRHSKICTAQGARDRRVRLSIGIARKFFDLQDTLGFDKASKTLDWLFTKSKTAIDELEQSNHNCSSTASECEVVVVSETNEAAVDPQGTLSKRNPSHLLARESRAKARARARERTREKIMCTTTEMSDSNPPAYTSSVNQDQSIVVTRKFKPSSAFDDSNNNSHPQHWDITSLLRVRASML